MIPRHKLGLCEDDMCPGHETLRFIYSRLIFVWAFDFTQISF